MRHRIIVTFLVLATAACGQNSELVNVPGNAAPVELPAQKNQQLADAIGPYRHHSSYTTAQRLVIRTPEAWAAAWDKIVGNITPKPAMPAIDFTTDMVILAAMGTRNSGGYAIDVPGVLESPSTLFARVRSTSPGNTCVVTGALTAPVAAVIVPTFSGTVQFIEDAVIQGC